MFLLLYYYFFFFLNDPAPTEIYPLPLHDALPISGDPDRAAGGVRALPRAGACRAAAAGARQVRAAGPEPERRRPRARVAWPAGPPLRRRRRRLRLAPRRPSLRPPLTRNRTPTQLEKGGVYYPPPSRSTVAGIGARVGRGFGPNVCFLLHSTGPTVRDRRRRQNPGRATHRGRVCADPRLRAHRRRPHRGARREGRLGGLALPPERRLSLGFRADPGRRPRRVVPTGAIRAVQLQPALPAGLERARNDLRDGGRFGAPDRRDEPPARRPPLAAARALPQGRRPRRRRADALAPRAPLRLRPRRRAVQSPRWPLGRRAPLRCGRARRLGRRRADPRGR